MAFGGCDGVFNCKLLHIKLLVTVKVPENVFFTLVMRNPDGVPAWGTIFYTFPESIVPLTFPISRNVSPICVVGFVVVWHSIPEFIVVEFKNIGVYLY